MELNKRLNLIGTSVIALAAGVSFLSYLEYKDKEDQKLMQMAFEQRLALLEKQQQQQNESITSIKYKQTQQRKQLNNLKQEFYSKLNHDRMLRKFKRVPDVKVYRTKQTILSLKERYCLAKNIYHEAAYEPKYGMLAVGQVTGNRVKKKHGGSTFCEVVHARKAFSWTLDKGLVQQKPEGKEWRKAVAVAVLWEEGYRVKGLERSRHYYARYIKEPYWAPEKQVLHYIGEHIFLKD